MGSYFKPNQRKLVSALAAGIFVAIGIGFCSVPKALAKYSGGTGAPNEPYRIATAADLNDIGNYEEDWDKHFILVNDVNLATYTGTQFKMIGEKFADGGIPFTGVFDGNNHAIANFTYTGSKEYAIGLFEYIGVGSKIMNLGLEDVNVTNNYWDGNVGALVGVNRGTILNCYAKGRVSGVLSTGGIVGYNYYGIILNSYASGTVSGENFTGGFVGGNLGTILNCYGASKVYGYDYTGGLVGENYHGTISCCYVIGEVNGTQYDTGGLIGVNVDGTILNCYSDCNISGNETVGGLLGYNRDSSILYCYSAATVNGSTNVGGLLGYNYSGVFTSCFWDKDINPTITGVGNVEPDPNGAIGETIINMKKKSTLTDAGWDFVEIWGIGENQTYPFLRTEPAGDSNYDGKVDLVDLAILGSHWLACSF
jgi:hypothetical protein